MHWAQVGYPNVSLDVTTAMDDVDIVVGYRRSIVEAMARGKTAYVFDHAGADGWGHAGLLTGSLRRWAAGRRCSEGFATAPDAADRELNRASPFPVERRMRTLLDDRRLLLPVLLTAVVIAVGSVLIIVLTKDASGGGTASADTAAQDSAQSAGSAPGGAVKVDITNFKYVPRRSRSRPAVA